MTGSQFYALKSPSIVCYNLAQETFLSEAGRNTDGNLRFIRDRLLEATDSTQLLEFYTNLSALTLA
jgi:hypothetical protein